MKFNCRLIPALLLFSPLITPVVAQQHDDSDELSQRPGPKYGNAYPPQRPGQDEPDSSRLHEDHRDTEGFHRPARVHKEEDQEDSDYPVFPPPKKTDAGKNKESSAEGLKEEAAQDIRRPTIKKPAIGASDEILKNLDPERKPAHPAVAGHKLELDDALSHDAHSESTRPEDALMDDLNDSSDDEGFFDFDDDEDGVHDIIPWDSFFGSFSSIAATEIGDKTFIVAALMAMRHPRFQVFTAAFSALFIMTILSGVTGHAVGALISKAWSALLASLLFLVFGAKSLKEGLAMSPDQGVSEEIREVEAELEEKEVDMSRGVNGVARTSPISPYNLEAGRGDSRKSRSRSRMSPLQRSPSSSPSPSRSKRSVSGAVGGIKNLLLLLLSPAWVETFSMTFIGELGDRSQIATVAMAAGQEYRWVMIGATLGHFVCTAGAVVGGSVLAGRVSMRKVTLVGGGIFIAFGLFTLLEAVQYW